MPILKGPALVIISCFVLALGRRAGKLPGPHLRAGEDFEVAFLEENSSPQGSSNTSEAVHLVTCTDSKADSRFQMLMSRAQSMGYTFHWLNCSDAFVKEPNPKALWGVRLQHYQKFVEELPGDPIVAFVDAMDVIAEGPAAEAAARFAEFKTPLVFSCVSYPYPLNCAAYRKHEAKGHCTYPCGGASMGRASGFRNLFQHGGGFKPETDDQCWLYSALNEHLKVGDEYRLDSESRLFLSYTSKMTWLRPYSLEKGRHVMDMEGLEPRPTFIHLDSGHPGKQEMAKLQQCQLGSEHPLCNQKSAGWWPAPAAKKILKMVLGGLTVLLVVALAWDYKKQCSVDKKTASG